MYKIVEVEDEVRVPASKIGLDLTEAIEQSVVEQYEGTNNAELGIVLAVEEIADVGDGIVKPGDGAIYYPAKFTLLTYVPQEHEVTLGEVVDITEFGAFVRVGPVDALTHISQVMNDYVSYDEKNGVLAGRESKRVLKEGDVVRARIISVSFAKESKIGLTMRQPHLGALQWIEAARERKEAMAAKQPAQQKQPKKEKELPEFRNPEEEAKEKAAAEKK